MSIVKNALFGMAVIAVSVATPARAALIIDSNEGGGAAVTSLTRANFDTLSPGGVGGTVPGGIGVSFTGQGQAAQGGQFAAPVLSGANGAGFGSPNQASGTNATTYLVADVGATSSVVLSLPGLSTYFGLLWGSIDAGNTVTFFNGATTVGSVSGVDVTATPDGDQGSRGTRYVNITSDTAFDRVVFTTTFQPFEFDNIAFGQVAPAPTPVPEPASLALFGAGLLGLGYLRRRRNRI